MLNNPRTYYRSYVSVLRYSLVSGLILFMGYCKKPYLPPVLQASNNYLVVDGVINTGTNSVTAIHVNRTRNLADTVVSGIPELHAQVSIVSSSGSSYPLQDTAGNGIYTSAVLSLDNTQHYNLAITTSDGRKYASDPVAVQPTPLIDSIYWEESGDFSVYLDTHDPGNSTHFYRWDYIETWEHDAQLQTGWRVENNTILPTDSITQRTICYTTVNSPDIMLGSTAKLSADLLRRVLIHTIPNGDHRLDNKYSILVRQYALTIEAYNYWSLIQKTSQTLGSLFDLQPTQLVGNVHGITHPEEPVIGFVSASSIQQQRIFTYNSLLTNWQLNPPIYGCDTLEIPVNQADYRNYVYPDSNYAPWYFITNGPLVLASRICLDCTLLGGNTIKPPYWK